MLHFAIYSKRRKEDDAIILSDIRTLRHHFHICIHVIFEFTNVNKIYPAVTAAICKRDFIIIIRSHVVLWFAVIGSSFRRGKLETQIFFGNFICLSKWLALIISVTNQRFSHIEELVLKFIDNRFVNDEIIFVNIQLS